MKTFRREKAQKLPLNGHFFCACELVVLTIIISFWSFKIANYSVVLNKLMKKLSPCWHAQNYLFFLWHFQIKVWKENEWFGERGTCFWTVSQNCYFKTQKLYRTAGKKHRGVFHRAVKLSDRVVRCVSEQYRFPFSSVLDGHVLPLMVLLGERELP